MTTNLTDSRDEALKVGYVAIVWPQAPMPFSDYVEAFKLWTVKAICRNNIVIGATYERDGELHVAVLPSWHGRWVTRNLLRHMFDMPKVIARPIGRGSSMYDYLIRLGFVDCGDQTLVKER